MEGQVGLFLAAFLSATILPGASEVALAALLLNGGDPWTLWGIATVGNTLGSVVNWVLGRFLLRFEDRAWFPFSTEKREAAERWFDRYGVWALTLGWVPVIGDAITFVAGLLRTPIWVFLTLVGVGKAARYAVVTLLLLEAF